MRSGLALRIRLELDYISIVLRPSLLMVGPLLLLLTLEVSNSLSLSLYLNTARTSSFNNKHGEDHGG